MIDTCIYIINDILFFCTGIILLYWFIFAIASHFKQAQYPRTKKQYHCAVLIPEENHFCNTKEKTTSYELITYKNLPETIFSLNKELYDIVILLSSEANDLSPQTLEKVYSVYDAGIKVIQLHSVIKDHKGFKRYMQVLSEEMNNSLYRAGNTQLGFSSNLYGANMAIDLAWLQDNIKTAKTNLERKLFKQNLFIEYLPNAIVYCESVPTYPYRKRTKKTLSYFIPSLLEGNWNFCNRIVQQILPSPLKLCICISIWTLFMTGYNWISSLGWWTMLFGLAVTYSLAIPNYLVKEKKRKRYFIWKKGH